MTSMNRRSIRLPDHDYSQAGAYFLTICSHRRRCDFGRVRSGIVDLSWIGKVIRDEWLRTALIRPEVRLDEFVVMPNHMHGIVFIGHTNTHIRPPPPLAAEWRRRPRSLGSLVAGFKSVCTTRINSQRRTPGKPVWQRNYYERIIRSDRALEAIRRYIRENPACWEAKAGRDAPTRWG